MPQLNFISCHTHRNNSMQVGWQIEWYLCALNVNTGNSFRCNNLLPWSFEDHTQSSSLSGSRGYYHEKKNEIFKRVTEWWWEKLGNSPFSIKIEGEGTWRGGGEELAPIYSKMQDDCRIENKVLKSLKKKNTIRSPFKFQSHFIAENPVNYNAWRDQCYLHHLANDNKHHLNE